MEKAKKVFAIVLALVLSISIIPITSVSAATKIKITRYKKNITVYVGENECLPIDWIIKGNIKIKWSSSNKKVVKVNKYGWIKGKKPGKATVTLKLGKKRIKFKVKVKSVYSINNKNITIKGDRNIYLNFYKANTGLIDCYSDNPEIIDCTVRGTNKNRVSISLYANKSGTTYINITNGFNNEKLKIKVTYKDNSSSFY